MSLDCVGTLLDPVKSYVSGVVTNYVSDIRNYSQNIDSLKEKLRDLRSKKEDIDGKVDGGINNGDKITSGAVRWLEKVRELIKNEELKKLMTTDTEVTKIVFQVMAGEQMVMKKLVREDREMQLIVEKAIMELKREDVEGIMKVMVEITEEITKEFKKRIKNDEKMALAVTKLLADEDLENLKKDDFEMDKVIEKAQDHIYKNFLENYSGEGDKLLVDAKIHLNEDSIQVAASELLKPLERLIDNKNFKSFLPKTLGMEVGVMVALMKKGPEYSRKMETEEEKKLEKQRYRECCSAIFICYYHSRYLLSKAAKSLAEDIQGHMVDIEVAVPKSIQELKPVPSKSINLESREKLALEIVKNLEDHGVNVVGVHGMGGSGKTKLMKQVANDRAIEQSFKSIVFVEISEAPNIKHIQDQIAQQLDMSIRSDEHAQQRARKLYGRLTFDKKQESKDGADKGKDILIILDNLWKKLDLEQVGIPDQTTKESRCKLVEI